MSQRIGLGCANLLRASLPELIELAARHGFPTITVRPLAFVQALEAGTGEKMLRRLLADAGVRATLLDAIIDALPGVPPLETLDPEARALLPADVLRAPNTETCFRCAEALELPVVNVVHYRGPALPLEQMSEAVGAICLRAKARGFRISLEFLPESGLPSLPFTAAAIAASGAPNCGITLDVFHLDRGGGTVQDILALPPGLIANIQISDRTPSAPGTHAKPLTGRQMPGEGQIPLYALTNAALANSPNATLDIEVLNEELQKLPMDEAAARLAAGARSFATIALTP